MSIITLATGKGGAGKTTVAAVIISMLASRGITVAALDNDVNETLYDWAKNRSGLPVTVIKEIDETKTVSVIDDLQQQHDVVIVDTAGAALQSTVFAVGCADLVLVPTMLSEGDLKQAYRMAHLTQQAAQMRRAKIPVRVIVTGVQLRTKIASLIARELERNQLPTMQTQLRRSVLFNEMSFTGGMPTTGGAGEDVISLYNELVGLDLIPNTNKPRLVGS